MDLAASIRSLENLKTLRTVVLSTLIVTALSAVKPTSLAHADTDVTTTAPEDKSTWRLVREKVRSRTFSEYMTPAVRGDSTAVPDVDGSAYGPNNAFNIAWMDYEVAKDWRVLYWQRFTVNFDSTSRAQGVNLWMRNPRFAIRKTNVFNNLNISSTYDVYIQPGLAAEGDTRNRNIEGGFRTATSYTIPSTRWNTGAITEFTLSYANKDISNDNNIYGWVMPWVSYDINQTVATQHFVTFNFKHERSKTWGWDDPFPYIQNGLGFNISKSIWAAAFINNYLGHTPTLKNTWASVWLSLTLL